MKGNTQRLAMTGSLSTFDAADTVGTFNAVGAANAHAHEHQSADRGAAAFLVILTALALVMGTMVPAAFADSVFASGSGTESDPYIIQTADQLAAFRDSVNSGTSYEGDTVKLAADITLPSGDWTPIGAGVRTSSAVATGATPFKGVFDGDDHTITGLTISTASPLASNANNALGFFGVLDGAHVNNLTLTNVNINVPSSDLAGGLAGFAINDSVINNVHVTGAVSGNEGIGGVLGRMTVSGAIVDSTNDATVTGGAGNVAGIVGAAYYTNPSGQMRIVGNKNTGDITGAEAVGGIVGLSAAFVSFNTNEGTITASSYGAGGIVGDQHNYGNIEGNHNSGEVSVTATSGYGAGGIAGWVRYNGAATAYQASSPINVTNNTNTASIKGGNDAGGIVGTMYAAGTVNGNTNEAASLSATTFAGGIVGNLQEESGTLPTTVTPGIVVEDNVSTTPLSDIEATNKSLFAYDNDPSKFTVANNSTTLKPTDSATDPDDDQLKGSDDPTQTPVATDPAETPTTNPALGTPNDDSATQQAGTTDKTAATDNATQTGASLQQTGDDLGRVLGVFAVLALAAGVTTLIVRKHPL